MQIIEAGTTDHFHQVVATHPRLLVDFHKDQCPGCRMLALSLQRVAGTAVGQGVVLLRAQLEVLGEPFFKATGFYLRGLPQLVPTNKLTPPKAGTEDHKRWSAVHRAPPGPDRWRFRSRTFEGVAAACAAQWVPEATATRMAKET